MQTALATNQDIHGFSGDQIAAIKSVINFTMSDADLHVFLHICRHARLDPISRQIYAISRGGKMTIQTSIDGLRTIAERTGRYAPGRDTEFLYDAEGRLVGAKAYVKKLTQDGTWHEVSATAFLAEYSTGQNLWKRLPHVMIEKVCESRALRRAFPADMIGLYADEEMQQADYSKTPNPIYNFDSLEAEVSEDAISPVEWKNFDEFVNGHTEIRAKLMKICSVSDLRKITKKQLEACRAFTRKYLADAKSS